MFSTRKLPASALVLPSLIETMAQSFGFGVASHLTPAPQLIPVSTTHVNRFLCMHWHSKHEDQTCFFCTKTWWMPKTHGEYGNNWVGRSHTWRERCQSEPSTQNRCVQKAYHLSWVYGFWVHLQIVYKCHELLSESRGWGNIHMRKFSTVLVRTVCRITA